MSRVPKVLGVVPKLGGVPASEPWPEVGIAKMLGGDLPFEAV